MSEPIEGDPGMGKLVSPSSPFEPLRREASQCLSPQGPASQDTEPREEMGGINQKKRVESVWPR